MEMCGGFRQKKDDLLYVTPVDCEMLRRLDYNALLVAYGDMDLFSLLASISKDIIKCQNETEGYRNRCRVRYYDGVETRKLRFEKPESPKLERLCSWEIVVGKCMWCGHVSNLERWRVNKVTKPA